MSNILVTGKTGQLGRSLQDLAPEYPEHKLSLVGRELNLADTDQVLDFIEQNSIDIIINCVAYTAVDKAESEPDEADIVNHQMVANLAQIAKEKSISLVHISTDYVFSGTACKPYTEDDATAPESVYGKTKLQGEQAILNIAPANTAIIRTSWLYSEYGNNFVKTMMKLGAERDELNVVCDQIGSPTYAGDLAQAIMGLLPINNQSPEVYHFSNNGVASWYDFAVCIMDRAWLDCKVLPIPSAQYPTPAPRPFYSVLDKSKIEAKLSKPIPHWQESLDKCIEILK
jgi:dTDP-4-dehydrorhamnose reductase